MLAVSTTKIRMCIDVVLRTCEWGAQWGRRFCLITEVVDFIYDLQVRKYFHDNG